MPELKVKSALPFQFESLKTDPAFMKLIEKAEKIIEQETKAYFDMPEISNEEIAEARVQKLKVKHYQEFWRELQHYMTATIAQKTNPKYKK